MRWVDISLFAVTLNDHVEINLAANFHTATIVKIDNCNTVANLTLYNFCVCNYLDSPNLGQFKSLQNCLSFQTFRLHLRNGVRVRSSLELGEHRKPHMGKLEKLSVFLIHN